MESLPQLIRAADDRIRQTRRTGITLVAVLAAFPLMLMALVVMVLAGPVALPGPSLSLAAAVLGCLLTGALIFLGAWAASAVVGPASRAPDAPPF